LVLHRIFLAWKSGRENGPPSRWAVKEEEIVHEQIGEGGMGTIEVKAQP
jgi:hypothetical protein